MRFRLMHLLLLLLSVLVVFASTKAHATDVSTVSSGVINYATSGDKTLVAAVANKRVRVYRWLILCSGANNIILKDSAGTTLLPIVSLLANTGIVLDMTSPTIPWFTTTVSAGLVLNLSAAQQCSGTFYYTQE